MMKSWLSLALLSLPVQALAFPKIGRPIDYPPQLVPAPGVTYDFSGIIALSNCSGSLVRFDDSAPEDKAMILTNGHCVQTGLIPPGEVLVDRLSLRSFTLLGDKAQRLGTLHGERLIYATMTKTDMALYRVKETYADIQEKYAIEAYTLAREAPVIGTEIQVVSGYWKKGYSCQLEFMTPTLQEGEWLFQDSLRYSRPGCEVIGGTSGSPVIATGTRTVVAVNNTVNESGLNCKVNNPCEIDAAGKKLASKGYGYAQETFWVYSCRNESGTLDLGIEGCLLPKPLE